MSLLIDRDISVESVRAYSVPHGDSAYTVTIENPVRLRVSASGAHMVTDKDGWTYYIPKDYISIAWKSDDSDYLLLGEYNDNLQSRSC